MKVVEIWRYPVKSMQGERLASAEATERGIQGDRIFAVKTVNGHVASSKNVKRFGSLFECAASGNGRKVRVRLPSGDYAIGECEEPLSAFLREPVYLSSDPGTRADIDCVDLDGTLSKYASMSGSFFDTAAVHILFTDEIETLRSHIAGANLDVRRFRPNVLVEGGPGAPGPLKMGDVTFEIEGACPRCIMTTLPQPGGIPRDVEILKTINSRMSGNLGWLAHVVETGTLHVGDVVT